MAILSKIQDFMLYLKESTGYVLYRLSAKCVAMENGNDLQTEINTINNNLTYQSTNVNLWSGTYLMSSKHTINLKQAVSAQPHGICLSFTFYNYNSGVTEDKWFHIFIPKWVIKNNNNVLHNIFLADSTFGHVGVKSLYITDTTITGIDENVQTGTGGSGIKYYNNYWTLRRVIGV